MHNHNEHGHSHAHDAQGHGHSHSYEDLQSPSHGHSHEKPLLLSNIPEDVKKVDKAKIDPYKDSKDGEVCVIGEKGVNYEGVGAIVIFYLIVLVVGVVAGWMNRHKEQNQEQVMLAGRDIGLFVGVLTMGATWVGGGFINGTAEVVYTQGLVWCIAPFGYAISLFIGGAVFAGPMRDEQYVTMIDHFMQKFGKWGALQALPAAVSELFWSASILGALGSTLQVILHLDETLSVIVSAVIALFYTLIGGLISVCYTDVIQIFLIALGLFLALPFAVLNPAVDSLKQSVTPWYGTVESHQAGEWADYVLLCIFGGIPWQCYYQRVLSSKSPTRARLLSFGGCAIALIMVGPAIYFGAVAKATDWSQTDFSCGAPSGKIVVPVVLQYLTPKAVAFLGLGAVSAAVMSSTDSSMLSASTMLARNIYHKVFRPEASEREVILALSVCIVINSVIATVLAITYKSIYSLFVLCGDFVYVMVFPQLLLVMFLSWSNTYGSVLSFFLGLIIRLLVGEKKLGLAATFSFGELVNDVTNETGPVPFRTYVMLISLASHVLVSGVTHLLFTKQWIGLRFDFLGCYKKNPDVGKIEMARTRMMDMPEGEDTFIKNLQLGAMSMN